MVGIVSYKGQLTVKLAFALGDAGSAVTLDFVDDAAHPDLVVIAGTIEVRFRNTGTTFVPMT